MDGERVVVEFEKELEDKEAGNEEVHKANIQRGPVVERAEKKREVQKVTINAMTLRYKALVLVLNLLPRTVIAVWLSVVGSEFLLMADDMESLIFNSCALAFLLEVDNMVHRAVTPEDAKSLIRKCEPLEVYVPAMPCYNQGSLVQRMLTCFIIFATVVSVMLAYFTPDGKYNLAEALNCLCQTEGEDCVVANFLGGQTTLDLPS